MLNYLIKNIKLFIILISFPVVGLSEQKLIELSAKDVDYILDVIVENSNKTLPKQIDPFTRLDGLRRGKKKLTYSYTIIVDEDQLIDGFEIELFKQSTLNTCSNIRMRSLVAAGVKVVHQYSLDSGKKRINSTVTSRSCL